MKRVFLKNYFRSMLLDRVCVFLALQFYVLKHEVCHRLTKIKKSFPEETSFTLLRKDQLLVPPVRASASQLFDPHWCWEWTGPDLQALPFIKNTYAGVTCGSNDSMQSVYTRFYNGIIFHNETSKLGNTRTCVEPNKYQMQKAAQHGRLLTNTGITEVSLC